MSDMLGSERTDEGEEDARVHPIKPVQQLDQQESVLKRWCSVPVMVAFAVWVILTVVAVVSSGRVFVIALMVLVPILLCIPMRYFYTRLLRPFTWPVSGVGDEDSSSAASSASTVVGVFGSNYSRSEVIAATSLFLFFGLCVVPLAFVETLTSSEPVPFMVVGYNLFGSLIFLLLWCCLTDLLDIGRGVLEYCRQEPPRAQPLEWFTTNRRWQRVKAGVIFLGYAVTLAVSLSISYSAPETIEVAIALPKWPACLDSYRIVLVTDVHAGVLVGAAEVGRLAEQVNALKPDVILLDGDFADGSPEGIGGAVAPLAALSAPDGVYFVTGNHESLHGSTNEEWMRFHESLGTIALNNSRVELPRTPRGFGCSDTFDLVGVGDIQQGDPDIDKALRGRDPSRAAILLAHQPGHGLVAAEKKLDLHLGGHVHAGQIWPLHGITFIAQPFFAGLERKDDTLVYTSSGAFGWGPRTRLGSRNNIDHITLSRGPIVEDPEVHYSIIYAWLTLPFFLVLIFSCIFCGGPATTVRRACNKSRQKTPEQTV